MLPDEGRFDDVAADLPRVVAAFNDNRTAGATLAVPRFETRFGAQLTPILKALGLTAPYLEGNLTGMADDPRLVLDVVAHQTFVAMDEEGTEAAAATVATGYPTSAPAEPPVPVVLDRPFLFRIFDVQTGATLFLGRVVDPTR
jgi:serpin B